MAKQSYYVLPGVEYVNGARVPSDRIVQLTPYEAEFDIEQGRIVPGSSPPTGTVPDPVIASNDKLQVDRSGNKRDISIADLVSFLAGGGISIALSAVVFASGLLTGAVLATISAPTGWTVVAETTFGGRVTVSGNNLVAAQDLTTAATGTARLKATSPDGTQTLTRLFTLEVAASTGPSNPDASAPGGGPNNLADLADPNNAYLVALAA